ncbi:MAG TPA: polysaccharide biosynthesis tyrosine autokinase [Nocardioidaceae bacterium]|nr:polysaccharide biosynthesis tyrosine autokinase [Nocardioidaceae bacterium]
MDQDLIRLQDHLAVLRRRWRLVALCVVIAVGLGLAWSFSQTKMYSGTASLLLEPQQTTTDNAGVVMDPEEVATQADVVASVQVAELVASDLGLQVDNPQDLLDDITVSVVEDKRVVEVSALESSPQLAADVANSFAEQYIVYREDQTTAGAEAQTQRYTDQIQTLEDRISTVRQEARSATGNDRQDLRAEESGLLSQKAALTSQLELLQTSQTTPLPGGEVLLRAEAPSSPAEPQPIRAGLLAAVIGLIVGVGLAYARDRLDDAVRDEERLRIALGGRPILGSIPNSDDEAAGRVATLMAPQSPLSEAYRALNTNVRFLLAAEREHLAGRGDVLMVTSAGPGEGKTSVATNLAVAASRVGLRVIVVDADLRRPAVADRFGLDVPIGLSDLLAAGGPAEPHLHEVGLDDLRVLAAGSIPPNPAELLASPLMTGILDDLAQHADLVVVDTAPVLRVADSLELIDQINLLLLVARRKISRLHQVSAAVDRIRQVGGSVSGAAFNDVDTRDSTYRYGYTTAEDEKSRRRRRTKKSEPHGERVSADVSRRTSG